MPATDLAFQAAPRISRAQFGRVLVRYHSPAAPFADVLYGIFVAFGIDPAVALAFFEHESKCGTTGFIETLDLKNWGAVRTPMNPQRGVQIDDPKFFKFSSWELGARDWCERINQRYVAVGMSTVARALPIYAPSKDGNRPAVYTTAVCALVAQWQAEDGYQTPTKETAMLPALLAALGVVDVSGQLPKRDWIIGIRERTDSITVHYNGPAVPVTNMRGVGLLAQLANDAKNWQMKPGWGNTLRGAPHIMYHFAVADDGTIYLLCGLYELLWHCAHQDGNAHGLAIHLALGEGQDATPIQWTRTIALIEALRALFGIARSRVVGHIEWLNATKCPGLLQPRVLAYRAGATPAIAATPAPAGVVRYRVKASVTDGARIRQKPAKHEPDGREVTIAGKLKAGQMIWVDVIKPAGELIDGDPRWAHMARVPDEQGDLGFVWLGLLELVAP